MNNWLVKAFVRSVVAGLGWKLGAEAYEAIKQQVKKHRDKGDEAEVEEGAAATQTEVVDVSKNPVEDSISLRW